MDKKYIRCEYTGYRFEASRGQRIHPSLIPALERAKREHVNTHYLFLVSVELSRVDTPIDEIVVACHKKIDEMLAERSPRSTHRLGY